MHRPYTIILSMLLLLLAGCGTWLNREPDWVRNPKTVYPEDRYLVAVGAGDTRRAAENAAAANLSRIFEAHIESDERVVDTVRETMDEFTRSTDLTTDINILSSQTLINIQHAEAWNDAYERYHAVAYLNRRETAAIYRGQVEELLQATQAYLAHAARADSLLDQYALQRAAVRSASDCELLLRQLKVIHPPTAAALAPSFSVGDIARTASDTARKIRVGIAIQGDVTGEITACLEALVTRYGFVAGRPATLHMNGSVSVADTGKRAAGLAFFNYTLAVQVNDAQGNVLATIHEKGREAVTTPSEARVRCYRTLEKAIQTKGVRSLDAYFDALVEPAR